MAQHQDVKSSAHSPLSGLGGDKKTCYRQTLDAFGQVIDSVHLDTLQHWFPDPLCPMFRLDDATRFVLVVCFQCSLRT